MKNAIRLSVGLLLSLTTCDGSAKPTPTPCSATANCLSGPIGQRGGQIADADGSATLSLPAGAVSVTTDIEVGSESLPPDFVLPQGAIPVGALVYAAGAASLAQPATLVLSFDPASLVGLCTTHATLATAADVTVLTSPSGAAGSWTLVNALAVNATEVSIQTTALQYFVPVVVIYDTLDPSQMGFALQQILPDLTLSGSAVLNTAVPAVGDPTDAGTWQANLSFEWLHNQSCNGFRYAYLDVSAVWCPHDQVEAEQLVGSYVKDWVSKGGLVVSVLEQGETGGSAASEQDLATWIKEYQVDYTMALDEGQELLTAAGINAWPADFIIRLADMRVMLGVFGAGDAFYAQFDSELTSCDPTVGTGCPAGQSCSDGSCQ